MKNLIFTAILLSSAFARANPFQPESRMELQCRDSLSDYKYNLTILDIGDQSGKIAIYKNNKKIAVYGNVIFFENLEASHFVAIEDGKDIFSIVFPNNSLDQAYFAAGGNSRALYCKIIKK